MSNHDIPCRCCMKHTEPEKVKAPATDLYCGNCTCKTLGRSSCYEKFYYEARELKKALRAGEWIGFDLDGTLAHDAPPPYPGVGAPIPLMVARVRALIACDIEVRIVTARLSPERHDFGDTVEEQRAMVEAWTAEHIGVRLQVQAHKDGFMRWLYDDRAISVQRNTGYLL